jgi:hypothetical protein
MEVLNNFSEALLDADTLARRTEIYAVVVDDNGVEQALTQDEFEQLIQQAIH